MRHTSTGKCADNTCFNAEGGAGYNFSAGKVNLAGGMAGLGTHGSLSPADMRACLACSGPAFRPDVDIRHATGHPDVVPTVLAALGLGRPASVEGRPILAALRPRVAAAAVAAAAPGEVRQATVQHRPPTASHCRRRCLPWRPAGQCDWGVRRC